jgi:predicted transcriptional regulator
VNQDFEKLVIHISRERADRLDLASEKLKLSRASILRQALDEFFDSKNISEKPKKQ